MVSLGLIVLLSAVGCAGYSLYCLFRHLSWHNRLKNALGWPETKATLVGEIELNSGETKYFKYYWAGLTFSYTVAGKRYQHRSNMRANAQWADNTPEIYKSGSAINLRYNPAAPEDAMIADEIERTSPFSYLRLFFIFIILAVLLSGMGAILLFTSSINTLLHLTPR